MAKRVVENLAGLSAAEIDERVHGKDRRNLNLEAVVTPENQAAWQEWLRASGIDSEVEAQASSDDRTGSATG